MICTSIELFVSPILKIFARIYGNTTVCYPDWFDYVISWYNLGYITVQELTDSIVYLYSNNILILS